MSKMSNDINSDEDSEVVVYESIIPKNIKLHEVDCIESDVNNTVLWPSATEISRNVQTN